MVVVAGAVVVVGGLGGEVVWGTCFRVTVVILTGVTGGGEGVGMLN